MLDGTGQLAGLIGRGWKMMLLVDMVWRALQSHVHKSVSVHVRYVLLAAFLIVRCTDDSF